jgi:hypothetical protein
VNPDEFGHCAIDNVEKNLPEIIRLAEFIADRHLKAGRRGFSDYDAVDSQTKVLASVFKSNGVPGKTPFHPPWSRMNARSTT